MKFSLPLLIIVIALLFVSNLYTRPWRVAQIPNGSKYQCLNCHFNIEGGGPRNPFGQTVEDNLSNGNVRWDLIFNIDSDGDGFTNGQELQDPNGQWAIGFPDPGDVNLVTKQWDPKSKPATSEIENSKSQISSEIYPNPVSNTINLRFISNYFEKSELSVFDINGNKIYYEIMNTKIGENNIQLNLRNITSQEGVYFILFRNKYFEIKKKITFKK